MRTYAIVSAGYKLQIAAVTQHLKLLRAAGLVSVRRAGRERYYRLNPRPLHEVADWVGHYERFWRGKLDALRNHLDENPT